MSKWEYRILFLSEKETSRDTEDLNTFGEDGWELVGVVQSKRGLLGYLKREKIG